MNDHDSKLLIDAQLREKFGDEGKGWLKVFLILSLMSNLFLIIALFQARDAIARMTS